MISYYIKRLVDQSSQSSASAGHAVENLLQRSWLQAADLPAATNSDLTIQASTELRQCGSNGFLFSMGHGL